MQQEQENLDRWARAAAFWEAHREIIRTMFSPITRALVEGAAITPGQTVLDVSTGPGEPALELAEIVGPEGQVIGIDPIAGMIDGARRAVAKLGVENARFEVASVDALPFEENYFDAVVCRLGAMFFPTPLGGVREMLRVLKPGRKLAFAVWNDAGRNPFFYSLSRIIDRYVEPSPIDPDAPDAFRFAHEGKLRAILAEAGIEAPSERVVQFPIFAPLTPEDFWSIRTGLSEKFQQKFASLNPQQSAEVRAKVIDAFREYSVPGGISFPSEVRIVSGSKRFST